MPDPTEIVLTTCFLAALGIFASTALVRHFRGKNAEPAATIPPVPGNEDSPYQAPVSSQLPPPLPVGQVPTGFYRPFDLLGIGLIYVIFFGLVIGSVRASETKELVLNPTNLITSIGFQFIIAGIVTMLVIKRIRPVDWLGLRWKSWPWVFLIAPATVLAMWILILGLQAAGYMRWIESLGVESIQEAVKLLQTATDPVILGLMAFAAVIVAPLCEEIVFRGYLYPAAKKFAGPWAAGVFSALIFASAHSNLSALPLLFILGLVLVFIYEKTGSLWAPIAVHFCFNGATVAVQMAARFLELPIEPMP
jgi:membrane protease YdiL (CAAX protease family)